MKKFILGALLACTLSSCATIFYQKPPTFQQAPVACVADILFGFLVAPTAVDMLYGACKVEGLKR